MANKTEWSPGPKCGPDKSGQLSLVWSILAILFDLQCKQQCDKVVAFSLPSPLLVSKFYFPPIRWQRGLTRGLLTSARDVLALGSSAALSWLDRVERAPRESRVWPPLLSNVECRRGTKLFRRTECWEKEAEKGKGGASCCTFHENWNICGAPRKYQVRHQRSSSSLSRAYCVKVSMKEKEGRKERR